jgi:hypothetical protein
LTRRSIIGYTNHVVVGSLSSPSGMTVATQVQELLTPTIGKFTARKAVELVAQKCALDPDQLDASHENTICETLRPMLRTLVGGATAERVLNEVRLLMIVRGSV